MGFLTRTITFNEKELEAELARLQDVFDELRSTLAEALDWIERPVETQEDGAYFLLFEERAKKLLSDD